jgi:hypothetical protein
VETAARNFGSRRSAGPGRTPRVRAAFRLDLRSPARGGAPHGIGRRNQGKLASFPEFLANFSRSDCEPLHTSRFGDHCEGPAGSIFRRSTDRAVVIAFPITVTGLLDAPTKVDLDKIKIEIPGIELPPPLDFGQSKN